MPALSRSIGVHLGPRPVSSSGGGTPTPTSAITETYPLGWKAAYNGTPSARQPGDEVRFVQQGYDGSYTSPGGVPTPTLLDDIEEMASVRHQCREPYADDDQPPTWTNDVALSTYPYVTTAIPGATNGSTEVSPKPGMGWAIPPHKMVGNSINLQLVAGHRNARNREQVPCVVVSVTDGTSTVYGIITQSSILTHPSGAHPIDGIRITGYEVDLDISSLADNSILTANAKGYVWVGDENSIADSSTGTQLYDFAPITFYKSVTAIGGTTRPKSTVSAPVYAYVSNAGVDATVDANGAATGTTKVSTTAATARANPFASIPSALVALKAATNITGGWTDGCRIRVMDDISIAGGASSGTYSYSAAVIIERDPLVASIADAVVTLNATVNLRQSRLWWKNLRITRTGAYTFGSSIFEDCEVDGGGFNAGFGGAQWWIGCPVEGGSTSFFGVSASYINPLIRSCLGVGSTGSPEACVLIGNKGIGLPAINSTRQLTRAFVGFNMYQEITAGVYGNYPSGAITYSNHIYLQNVVIPSGTTASYNMSGLSQDSQSFNIQNLVWMHNTTPSAWNHGRLNWLYDDTIGVYRNHKLACWKASVFGTLTSKSEYFVGKNGTGNAAECALHVNSQNILYGVDIDELWLLWPDADGLGTGLGVYTPNAKAYGSYGPYTFGRNSTPHPIAADSGLSENDAKFKSPGHSTFAPGTASISATPTAGAGTGDYRPMRISEGDPEDSPLLGKVANPYLRFGLDGTERAATNDTIGAYA